MWLGKEESTDQEESVDLSDMPPLEGDKKEVKEGKGLEILTPKKILTRLQILLVQIKDGNNSYKLKNEIRQILYLLYQHNKIIKKVHNNLAKSNHGKKKTFHFGSDWPKDVDENLKHKIEFIVKSNESLAENKIKNEIEQLLSKHNHGNNIHVRWKQINLFLICHKD